VGACEWQAIFIRGRPNKRGASMVAHRVENPGVIPLVMIEVQNGEYLGEDDIIRFEDADEG